MISIFKLMDLIKKGLKKTVEDMYAQIKELETEIESLPLGYISKYTQRRNDYERRNIVLECGRIPETASVQTMI